MPPRKSASATSRGLAAAVLHYGAAVRDELPPLPSRIQTSYGSEYSQRLINPRRGQTRVLNSAIDDALQEAVDDTSDPVAPEEEGKDQPDEDPQDEEEGSSPAQQEEDGQGKLDQALESDTSPSPERESVAPLPPRSVFQSRKRGRQDTPAVADDASDPSPSPRPRAVSSSRVPGGRTRKAAASPTPVPRSTRSTRAATAEPSPGDLHRTSRFNPRSSGDLDSSRSFGNESTIFRGASIHTPQPQPEDQPPKEKQPFDWFEEMERMHDQPIKEASRPLLKPGAMPPPKTPRTTRSRRRKDRSPSRVDDTPTSANTAKPAHADAANGVGKGTANIGTVGGTRIVGAPEEIRPNIADSRRSGSGSGSQRVAPADMITNSAGMRQRRPRARGDVRNSETAAPGSDAPHFMTVAYEGVQNGLGSLGKALRRVVSLPVGVARGLLRKDAMRYIKAIGQVVVMTLLVMFMTSALSSNPAFGNFHWYGWSDLSHNVGQFIPFSLRYGLQGLSPESRQYHEILTKADYEIKYLARTSSLHDESLKKLEALMPKVIQVNLGKGNKPVVADDFWHALRDLIKADGHILTLDETRAGLQLSSDEHWAALKQRMQRELQPGHMPKEWEKWIASNREKVTKILNINQTAPVQVDNLTAEAMIKLVKEKLKSGELTATLVTREEFMRYVNTEFKTHRQEIRQEFREMEPKLKGLVQDVVNGALKSQPSGIARDEVLDMVNKAVRKAISDAHLAAMAKGKVMATWDSELRHQVNFLSPNSGAVVNVPKSSPRYEPERPWIGTKKWLRWGRTPHPPSKQHNSVLAKWEDEGDCWCGAITEAMTEPNFKGVWTSINLGHNVIPQHIVVEHILPGATLKPDARPRDIEVWAAIEGVGQQQLMAAFANSHWPTDEVHQYCPIDEPSRCYFKIAAFTYESSDANNGVYVHRLSEALATMGAATDHIRVVATTNYGNQHQTCFYRIRMFGELVPDEDALDDGA